MLRYGFFDSEITGYDEEGMPVFDRAESSDFLAMFISRIISDGVLAEPADCFQVLANEGMKLKVRPGFGIVKGRFAMDTQEFEITIPTAPTAYKRIDRVILRANYLQRLCEIIVRAGEPGANPVAPELLQPASGDYYELCLATVAVNSNQTVITQANITDTRYDSSVCGVVTQVIDHLDTSVFFGQLNQFYTEFTEQCAESYDFSKTAMNSYLVALQESGDSQLQNIVAIMTQFEQGAETSFEEWFQNVKDQLGTDVAGNLQLEIEELQGRCTDLESENEKLTAVLQETTNMLITGEVMAILTDSEDQALLTSDNQALIANWKYARV